MRGRQRLIPEVKGRRLRQVGRLYQDGRVFAYKPPTKGGGAVLIDASGSMGLSHRQLEKIVQALPGGIVASYAGYSDRKSGELRIIAEKGRYCHADEMKPAQGLNIIDGPALQWLASQRGPRYWVSDGRVTGKGELTSPLLTAECNQISKQAQIRRMASAEVLLA